MSALTIVRSALNSRAVRESLTNNAPRLINLSNTLAQVQPEGGLLTRFLNFGRRFVGFISAVIRGIVISASAIFEWLVNGVEALKQFNWNASDQQLRQMVAAQNISIASAWGSALGNSFGWIAAIGVGYGVTMLCPVIGGAALAKTVAAGVAPEALQEISASLLGAVRVTAQALGTSVLINGYMQYRNLLKRVPRGILARFYGEDGANFIKQVWGNEGGPDLSFNNVMDEFVEGIENPVAQAFVESFLEESWDGFVEAGFVIASEIDAAIESARAGSVAQLGPQKTVLITPDRNAPEEKLAVTGEEKLVKQTIQTTIGTHRLVYNRDVGQIVGQPAEDWYKAKPQRRQLVICWRDKPAPPWKRPDGNRCKQNTSTIPDAKVGLTWREVKRVCDPFTWGKYRCTANLDNGRQMAVYGATETEAERKLRQLLTLSTASLLTLSVTEEKDRNPRLRKEATVMYPCFYTLLIRRQAVGLSGRTELDGTSWTEDKARIPLWMDEEPPNISPLP